MVLLTQHPLAEIEAMPWESKQKLVPDLKAHWSQARGRLTGVAGVPIVLPDNPESYRSLWPDQFAEAYAEEGPATCPKWEEVQRASN